MHLFLYTIVNQNYAWNLEKKSKINGCAFLCKISEHNHWPLYFNFVNWWLTKLYDNTCNSLCLIEINLRTVSFALNLRVALDSYFLNCRRFTNVYLNFKLFLRSYTLQLNSIYLYNKLSDYEKYNNLIYMLIFLFIY